MKRSVIFAITAALICAIACVFSACTVSFGSLLDEMSYAGEDDRPDHLRITVSNGETLLYSYEDGEVHDPFGLDEGSFGLGQAVSGFDFTEESFSGYEVRDTDDGHVVTGTLADPAAFLCVDATSCDVEALIDDDGLVYLALTYVTGGGNTVEIRAFD